MNLPPPRPEQGALPADSPGCVLRLNLPHRIPNRTQDRPGPASGSIAQLPQRCPSVTLLRVEGAIVCSATEALAGIRHFRAFVLCRIFFYDREFKVAPRGATPLHVPLSAERPANSRIATSCYGARPPVWRLRIAARISVIPLQSPVVHDSRRRWWRRL